MQREWFVSSIERARWSVAEEKPGGARENKWGVDDLGSDRRVQVWVA